MSEAGIEGVVSNKIESPKSGILSINLKLFPDAS